MPAVKKRHVIGNSSNIVNSIEKDLVVRDLPGNDPVQLLQEQTKPSVLTKKQPLTLSELTRQIPEGAKPMATSSADFEVVKRVPYSRRRKQNTTDSNKISASLSTQPALATVIAPQIKIVGGKVVLDEHAHLTTNITGADQQQIESLTVVHESVDRRHFTSSTYSKYQGHSNRWSLLDTQLFYRALSMCGTDFAMIATLPFTGGPKTREQVKGKFRTEERSNPAGIAFALNVRLPFDPNKFVDKIDG